MRLLNLIVILTICTSCSLVKKQALNVGSSMMIDGSDEVFTEGNLKYFEKAAPGNIKLIEGMWYSDQSNEKFLYLLVKAYAGYSFSVLETNAFEEILLDEGVSKRQMAILAYEKAVFYGFKYLELKGIGKEEFLDKSFPTKLEKVFNSKLSRDDYGTIFYFAQAMGASVNLQRENVSMLSRLNNVRKMLSWVCLKDPTIENGNCSLFTAAIEASTPSLLGGSMSRAKTMFNKLMKENPENLLIKLSYVQFYLIPMLEELEYRKLMQQLGQSLNHWYDLQLGQETKQNKRFKAKRELNLYNAIARERYKIIKKLEKDIF